VEAADESFLPSGTPPSAQCSYPVAEVPAYAGRLLCKTRTLHGAPALEGSFAQSPWWHLTNEGTGIN
jgi:hypothetical protein